MAKIQSMQAVRLELNSASHYANADWGYDQKSNEGMDGDIGDCSAG